MRPVLEMNSRLATAKWIWRRQAGDVEHQYVCFRKELPELPGGKLYISADTDFVAYLNGQELGRGQFSDYPAEKTYSEFPVPPGRQGKNVLCVLAYYCGAEFSTYTVGPAGMIAALQCGDQKIVSDDSWRCVQSPAFQSGGLPRLTDQLGFVTKFDARNEVDWLNPDFDDSAWPAAEIWRRAATLSSRPVPPLLMGERVNAKIVMQGSLLRVRELETFADSVAADLLGQHDGPLGFEAPANGCFVIADLGAERVGLVDLELEAPAGAVVDISHGEHLIDGKVRNKIHSRNFTDRYICKEGLNHYLLPFRRVGGRYLQLNITNAAGPVSLHHLGVRPLEAPRTTPSSFQCGDTLAERTRAVGVRTLELCMHEHYEDCPWREQALYAYDSRNQMLYGYYVWGNYSFAAASLDLLGRGIRPDGLLELCAPSKRAMTIPMFSFVWVTALYEHWLHSGDSALFRKFAPQIEFMLGKIQELFDPENGLYRLSPDKKMWHFYEWAPGLTGGECQEGEHHALYNMYFHETLLAYAAMLRLDGQATDKYLALASNLNAAINRAFWDGDRYASKLVDGQRQGFHEHTQCLAFYNKLAPAGNLLATLRSGKLEAVTFSAMPYLLRALMPLSPDARGQVSATLSHAFDPMIFAGATSLWETKLGAADFGGAGSLCHAWSSLPVYYYHAWVLGVRPLEPGFKKFVVSPFPDKFGAARGSIPTPSGFIEIEWSKTADGLRITMTGPGDLCPVLSPWEEAPVVSATYNGVGVG